MKVRALAIVMACLAAGEASAQTVLGTAVDASNGAPVGGAFVLLTDVGGEEVVRGLTTERGTFRLNAPGPGTYRISLERIGFADLATEPFELGQGETLSRRLDVAGQPIELGRITVSGGPARCGGPPADALELSRVWGEARKALEATAWTDRQSYYRFDVLLIRRQLDRDGEARGEPRYEPIRVYGRHPFRSVQASDLSMGGWVQRQGARGLKFFAPDAEVLLSDSFLNGHCFRLVRSNSGTRRDLGIAFEPLPNRMYADISGVLWVDRQSAELLRLDYRYELLELPVETDLLGGEVEFDRLPDGGWIVRHWEIRTPEAVVDGGSGRRRQRVRLTGLQVEGQQVLAVWRTGDLQAAPGAEQPADVMPVQAPPDELIKRYPAPEY